MSDISRRGLIRGTAASLGLLAADLNQARAKDVKDPTIIPEGLDRLQSIMSRNRYTIFADAKHVDISNGEVDSTPMVKKLQFLAGKEFLDRAVASDVRTIAFEMGPRMQIPSDKLALGKISRETFYHEVGLDNETNIQTTSLETAIQARNAMADLIVKGQARGIKVVFDDMAIEPGQGTPRMIAFEKKFDETMAAHPNLTAAVFISEHRQEVRDYLLDNVRFRSSIAGNQPSSEIVRAATSERGGNTVLFQGVQHAHPLVELLGSKNDHVAVVRLQTFDETSTIEANNRALGLPRLYLDSMNTFYIDKNRFSDEMPTPAPHLDPSAAPKSRASTAPRLR